MKLDEEIKIVHDEQFSTLIDRDGNLWKKDNKAEFPRCESCGSYIRSEDQDRHEECKPVNINNDWGALLYALSARTNVILDHSPKGFDCDGDENGYEDISVGMINNLLYVRYFLQNPVGHGHVASFGSEYRKPNYSELLGLLKAKNPGEYYYKNIHYKVNPDEYLSDPDFI